MKRSMALVLAALATILVHSVLADVKHADGNINDVLQQAKNSGILDEWEDKLEEMLFSDNDNEESGLSNLFKQFINSYIKENGYTTEPQLIYDLVASVHPQDAAGLVQLGKVIDSVEEITKYSKGSEAVKKLSGEKSLTAIKDALVLKTKEFVKEERKKATFKPAAPNAGVLESMISSGDIYNTYKMFMNTLKEDPAKAVKLVLSFLERNDYLSQQTTSLIEMYSAPYVPLISDYIDPITEMSDMFVASESGERMFTMLPKLMQAQDIPTAMKLFKEEAEWNWATFFEKIANSDFKNNFLESLSLIILRSTQMIKTLTKDEMNMLLANGFLLSQGMPTFNVRRPFESFGNIVNKGIKSYSTYKFDVTPYAAYSEAAFQEFKASDFGKMINKEMDEESQLRYIARYMENELVNPMQEAWELHRYVSEGGHLDCAESLLCQINQNAGEETLFKKVVVKGTSIALAWNWSWDGDINEKYWGMYEAIKKGTAGESCQQEYDTKKCKLFAWQDQKMSLNYEHTEL